MERIIIIGCGGSGAALAHDLTRRGFKVTLIERGEVFSGATGRHHGLLHSGARYAVNDPVAARECFEENQLLRRIAPFAIEQNGGLFVALDDEDLAFQAPFLDGCKSAGIPTRSLSRDEALRLEPALSPETRAAVLVPDATFDAFRLPLSFLATALSKGAELCRFHEVVGFLEEGQRIAGVHCRDHLTETELDLRADLVVNATGAWGGRIASLAGLNLPIQPGPGVMVAVAGRFTERVINRLHPPSEGDIVLPQRKLTVLGTSLWLADDPDDAHPPAEQIEQMIRLGSRLVPTIRDAPIKATWSASRPLVRDERFLHDPQQMSRTFQCFDHGALDDRPGLLSLIGGKATTLRAMAEGAADLIASLLGHKDRPCSTRTEGLLPPRAYFHQMDGRRS